MTKNTRTAPIVYSKLVLVALIVLNFFTPNTLAESQANFQGLGIVELYMGSRALSVSGDGQTVTGGLLVSFEYYNTTSQWVPVWWKWNEDISRYSGNITLSPVSHSTLPNRAFRFSEVKYPLAFEYVRHEIVGASYDGSVIIGYGGIPQYSDIYVPWDPMNINPNTSVRIEAYRHDLNQGYAGLNLGFLDSENTVCFSKPAAINADGSVVVGVGWSEDTYEPFRWTEQTGMVGLGHLFSIGDSQRSEATGVSGDGQIVVGSSMWIEDVGYIGQEAFIWTEESGMTGLGILAGGGMSQATAISDDGTVVVGMADDLSGFQAFRWTDSEGMIGLGDLSGGLTYSKAADASADGSRIVGYGCVPTGIHAFVWDAENGMRDLNDLLVDEFGVDLTGWTLQNATGISDDGTVIVGYGVNPDGQTEGWVVALPEPATCIMLAAGASLLLFCRKRIVKKPLL
ncbi:MAG: hypothetical protein JXA11_17105 [Phycisphaerae bacterium]|nr:hypothetical protein [Phycisphaerae bacterium]